MYTFIEIWTPNDTWTALSAAEREAFMDGVGAAMGEITAAGVTTLGWGAVGGDVPHAVAERYVAVWQAPDRDTMRVLERAIEASGWYRYFDQQNIGAELADPAAVIGEHIAMT